MDPPDFEEFDDPTEDEPSPKKKSKQLQAFEAAKARKKLRSLEEQRKAAEAEVARLKAEERDQMRWARERAELLDQVKRVDFRDIDRVNRVMMRALVKALKAKDRELVRMLKARDRKMRQQRNYPQD